MTLADHIVEDKELRRRCHTGSSVPFDILTLPICQDTCKKEDSIRPWTNKWLYDRPSAFDDSRDLQSIRSCKNLEEQ